MLENIDALKNIPSEMKFNALWCGWKYSMIDGEQRKTPINVSTGAFAKSNDKSTFTSYPILLKYIHKYWVKDENGKFESGIAIGVFNDFSAVDIDNCVGDNGELTPMALDIVNSINSYTETSPSGHGIRIIFHSKKKFDKDTYYIHNAKLGLEIYISDTTNKFLTITGNTLSINDKVAEVDITNVMNKYMLKNKTAVIVKKYEAAENKLELGLKKDTKLYELYNGVAPGSGANESELDQSLCCKLAYWLDGDFNMIESEFSNSPYFNSKDDKHKRKWLEREDYRTSTINGAISLWQQRSAPRESPQYAASKLIDKADLVLHNNAFNYNDSNVPTISAPQPRAKLELTDTGNAYRFTNQFGDIFKYNVDNKLWMNYNGKYWQDDVFDEIKNYAEIIAEQLLTEANLEDNLERKTNMIKNVSKIYNHAGKEAMLKEAQHITGIPCQNSNFDQDGFLLGCKDCIIDLRTKNRLEFKKDYMISQSTGICVSFEKPKRWVQFMEEIFDGNKELINYIQKAFGYSLTNVTKEQCMFIFYGDGRNGKSLLLDIVRQAVGAYGVSTKSSLLTDRQTSDSAIDDLARLKGKRAIFVEETEINDKLKESQIKTLTSGIGEVVARRLYGNTFSYIITGKIFMSTNHLPVVRGNDLGIWRRLRVIPFNKIFVEGVNDDKDLREKLEKELPQILGWLIDGFSKYQNEGLVPPKCIEDLTKEYRAEMDIVQRWINERCDVGAEYFASGSVLFDDFLAYSQANKEFIMSNTLFGRNLVKKFERKRIGTGNVYMGIQLRKAVENLKLKVNYEKTKINVDDI